MAEAQLRQFREKVRQLNAFLALCDSDPQLLHTLRDCEHHDQVVALARRCGFEIARRWGEGGSDSTAGTLAPTARDAATPEPGTPAPGLAAGSTGHPSDRISPAGLQGWRLRDAPCPAAGTERSEVVLQTPGWRLERIHSCSAVSPEGFWYDQPEHEWVLLLQGSGRLQLADQPEEVVLQCGDSLLIPAGCRHRVSGTDPDPGTIWLALFWREPSNSAPPQAAAAFTPGASAPGR